MTGLAGKRAIVTGGGGAIGRASSLALAAAGACVAVVDIAADKAAETTRLIGALGGTAIAITADVSSEPDAERAVAAAAEALGGLDTLFNNAGIMPHQDGAVTDADLDLWRTITGINLHGTVLFSKYAIPHLERAGGGAIVNMSSFLAVMGCSSPQDGYAASKGAIWSLTRSMAVQLGPRQIRVNALAPGPIATPHVERFFPDPAARQLRLDRIPLGRFGTPEDAAGLACFLASDAAAWLTGQVIVLDGGISCHYL
jgi:NAD(P)-dependent dehydrogenase (short-subunit alcohol dehydrogenase family)